MHRYLHNPVTRMKTFAKRRRNRFVLLLKPYAKPKISKHFPVGHGCRIARHMPLPTKTHRAYASERANGLANPPLKLHPCYFFLPQSALSLS
jgi:hypothetical protein